MTFVFLALLFLKHFYADFVNQPPYMYLNKGNWKHPGGYLHALHHAVLSFVIMYFFFILYGFSIYLMLIVPAAEFVIHYLMDFTKVNICKAKGYGPTTHEEWFWWLGFDQLVHCLTYIWMGYMIST